MRYLILLSCLMLAACGREPPPEAAAAAVAPATALPAPAPAPVTPAVVSAPAASAASPAAADARRVLDAYLQAWNTHDGDAVAGFLAEDAVVFDALRGNLSKGRGPARAEVVDMYLRAVPDGQWSLRGTPVVSADGFSYEWALTGTNLGNWTGYLKGRGQKIDFKGISIVRLKDGKIAYQANYFDTNALGAQAGW